MSIYVMVPIASVVLVYLARMVELGKKRDTIRGRVSENVTLRLFMLAGTLMVIGSIFEFLFMHSRLYWPTFLGGWLLALLSFALRRKAIAALGRFWSLHVEIREEAALVEKFGATYVAYQREVPALIPYKWPATK